jgi:hypothetical protein
LISYLPRAFEIGYWAPFPNTWIAAGRRIGSAGKLLSGAETLVIYACQLLALLAVIFGASRLASWLLLSVFTLGVTALGLVIPNVGAIYRFRYTFWILLIILGMKGFQIVIMWSGRWVRGQSAKKKETGAVILMACFFFTTCSSCSSPSDSNVGKSADASHLQGTPPEAAIVPALNSHSLFLINSTGASLRGIYLSPSDSTGWEENVLSGEDLSDGGIVDIRFSPEEKTILWDLRVEAVDEHYAEWKKLDLREISRIRLLLGRKGEKVAVAEVE